MTQTSKSSKSSKDKASVPSHAEDRESGKPVASEDETERNIDEALEETFPASDPISPAPEKDVRDKGKKQ